MNTNTRTRIKAAAEATGLTVTQIRYLERLGLVRPSFVGAHRVYDEKEMERLSTVKTLLNAGFKPNQLRAVLLVADAIEDTPMTGKQVLARLLLENAERKTPFELPARDEREYNTAYKALGRLGRELGLRVYRRKEGDALTVLARPN